MKSLILLIFGIAFAPANPAAQDYFESNAIGMQLQPISAERIDEFSEVLEVRTEGATEIRRLISAGKETSSWQRDFDVHGVLRAEREYQESVLVARHLYDEKGRLQETQRFEDGRMHQVISLRYANDRLSGRETVDGNGNLLYRDRFAVTPAGRLRELVRTWPNGETHRINLVFGEGVLVEERSIEGDILTIARYSGSGDIFAWQQWVGDNLAVQQSYRWDPETGLLSASIEERFNDNRTIERSYDFARRVVEEIVLLDGAPVEETSNRWDGDGRKIGVRKKSELGIEEWQYAYDDEGSLSREAYSLRGELVRVLEYRMPNDRIEELYRNGGLFLRVYYAGEQKTQEEFIRNGSVVRTRKYGDQE